MGRMLQSKGYSGDDLTKRLDEAAADLDYKRHRAQSPQGTLPTLAKGIAVSAPSVMSQTLSGLPSYIPGEGKVDELMRSGAGKMKSLINPNWQQDVAIAASGPKWGKGMAPTWASLVGQQLPVLTAMGLGSTVGRSAGTLAGAGMGLATAGPDPSDIPLMAASQKAGGFAGGYGAMALLETGGFTEAAEELGLDRDILEEEGRNYGVVSGVFEQLQAIGMLSPYTKGAGKAGQKTLNKNVILPVLKTIGKEVGVAGLEGLEEVMQGAYFNKRLDYAVARQNQRNAEKGLPPVDTDVVESLKQDLREGFEAGFGVAAIIRGPGVTMRGVKARSDRVKQSMEDKTVKRGDKFFDDIMKGVPKEELASMPAITKPSVAAPGSTKISQEALEGNTVEQKIAIIDDLQPITMQHLAKKYGINADQSDADIRQEMKQRSGLLEEGPMYRRQADGKMGVDVVTPILNKVTETEALKGNTLDLGLRQMIRKGENQLEAWFPMFTETFKHTISETGEKLYNLNPQQQKNSILNALRYKALAPVIGTKEANALLPMDKTSMAKPTLLDEQLTRDQYAEYTNNLRGVLRDQITSIEGRTGETKVLEGLADEVDIRMDRATLISDMKDADGNLIKPTPPMDKDGNIVELPWYRRWAGMLPSLEDIAYKTNMPQLMWLDKSYMEGHKMVRRLYTALRTAEASRWAKIPKALRTGEPGRRMHDLVQWWGTDGTQKAKLSSTLKTPNTKTDMIKRVMDVSTLKDAKEIETYAKQLSKDYRVLYNWFVENGFIKPDQFHRDYMPVIYAYNKDSTKGNQTLVQWIKEQQNTKGKMNQLVKGLKDNDLQALAKVADNIAHWDNKHYATPGKNKAMAEYARKSDAAFLKEFDVISDARISYDHYIRQALQRMVYGDTVPVTSAIIQEVNRVLPSASQGIFNKVIGNYLESILGVPDSGSQWLAKQNLSDNKYVKSLITTPAMKVTNKGIDWFNKSPLSEKWGKIEVPVKDKNVNARDVMDVAVTWLYATSLGLPNNLTSPVKNLSQGPLNIAAVGIKRHLAGLVNVFNPETIKELIKMDLRPEMAGWEMEYMDAGKGGISMAAQGMLSLYRASDMINVFSAASSGLVGWKILEARMKEGKLSHNQVNDILWRGKKSIKVDDKAVMESGKNDIYKGVISKPVGAVINEMIDQGKMDEAKRLYIQYLVNFSQWRYGAGGTPGYMRNSIARSMFMFTSWPTNYIDYWTRATRPGMPQRYAQVAASQLILASLMTSLGYSAWRWILTGPLPKEMLPTGPLTQAIEAIWKILHGSAELAVMGLVPTVPNKEREKQKKFVQQQIDDVLN